MEEEVHRELRRVAAQERRTISELVQAAVLDYLNRRERKSGHRSSLKRFLDSPPFALTDEQFRETTEADFYNQ
ncbi:MAG: hypothetical protein ABSH34_13985 [Verrucomicrobiota bacterium]|jgi:hypothetical protein